MKLDDLEKIKFLDSSRLTFDHDLSRLNWFNIGGKSKIYLFANSLKDLSLFLNKYNCRGKIFILGAGSNILFSDEIFDGVIIKLGKSFNNISKLKENLIISGSSCLDKKVSDFAMENEIEGFEFLSCIPGSIGGGIKMNAGCYGKEFKDIIVSVQAIDFKGNVLTIPSNKSYTLDKSFTETTSIIDFKKNIEDSLRLNISNIVYDGIILEEDSILGEYGIDSNKCVILVISKIFFKELSNSSIFSRKAKFEIE